MSPHRLAGTVAADARGTGFGRFFAFLGPATLVGVGYMDPGNWATDLDGGARFGYGLLWVLLASNLVALLLQSLAARLGLVAGLDLAQACRGAYARPAALALWMLAQLAIVACDLAEVLGSAVALNLLFGVPMVAGAAITALDVFLVLMLQQHGMRRLEAIVAVLVLTIGACLAVELAIAKPDWDAVASGFRPRLEDGSLYIAVAILGATVMPHNLYLHSALVRTRRVGADAESVGRALRYSFVDTLIALNAAFLINAAILILAADVFHPRGLAVDDLREAHRLLAPLLGVGAASALFAIALLCAGQSATITGTLAGQVVMEGFLRWRLPPAFVRTLTRALAVIPAIAVLSIAGEDATVMLLVATQVVLSLQLPFAIVPLVRLVADRQRMGAFAIGRRLAIPSIAAAGFVIAANAWLVAETIGRTSGGWRVAGTALAAALAVLLGYLALVPLKRVAPRLEPTNARPMRAVQAADPTSGQGD